MARSELLSTFFPTWVWQGREWSKWRVPKYENYYWLNSHVHPVLSTYYLPQILVQRVSRLFSSSLDSLYKWFGFSILVHFLWNSIGWYMVLATRCNWGVAIFGALTFTYQAYHLKQQPCIIYTLSWFPWMLYGLLTHNILIGSISIGMTILAGYYPLAIYLLPISLIYGQWLPIGIGLLIGSVQLVPFLRYLPKTIKKVHTEIDTPVYEKEFYFGIVPIIVLGLTFKMAYLTAYLLLALVLILKPYLPRVSERAMLPIAYLLIYYCLVAMNSLTQSQMILILIMHSFDLYWHNRELLPARPFVELYEKPSRAFNNKLTQFLEKNLGDARVSGLPYPLFTGHINKFRTLGYCGSMQLKLMAKWRGDSNPNGSGHHDYFMGKEDEKPLVTARVKYAFSRSKLDWPSTEIRNLYQNPNYSN